VQVLDSPLRCLQALRKRGEPVAEVRDEKKQAVGVIAQQALISALLGEEPERH
jgi:CBS domain containing-hemolysin-like protein